MLKHTPLVTQHQNMGAKLVDFGGWSMPLHYGSQMEEHHHVRRQAGMFDVSHMTVVDMQGKEAKAYLHYLLANDVDKLNAPGKALYTAMLNEQGGVLDDLIVYRLPWGYRLVVNCATREKDLAWMQKQVGGFDVEIRARDDLAIIAVQGPEARSKADAVLADYQLPACTNLSSFSAAEAGDFFVARTGYTGEDGYEVILPATQAGDFWERLAEEGVEACGLGARDTLRLEAGLNLYGHEMDETVSPWVANMGWTLALEGDRVFIGKDALLAQKKAGLKETLVGLILEGKGVLRAGQTVHVNGKQGIVTSGSFSPTLGKSIALARVPSDIAEHCQVEIRNKLLNARVQAPCFVRRGKVL